MRPVRIEMEGFAAFRQRVVVDFTRALETDTALFSLSGPTGSGKSSLIDAMIFALYGRIPPSTVESDRAFRPPRR